MSAALDATGIPEVEEILADPASSVWIRGALIGALARDPVDALNDALVLAAALECRLRQELDLGEQSALNRAV